MFIQYAEIHGYKRFMLNSVKTFRLTMTEIVQIILGTNGSGKSSLIEELTPLPATKEKFIKGGYKIIIVHHQGDVYRLENHFNNGQEHFFIKNETEDLNPGNTMTVQRDMVKKIFGLTYDLHDLMIGVERFTNMSPARRREWFTKLCDADYSYSISVYKKAAEGLRDTTGALNILRKRYVNEVAKKIDEETIKQIHKNLTELTLSSQRLYSLKNVDVGSSNAVGLEVENQSRVIHDLDKQFRALRKEFTKDSAYSHSEINEAIDDLSEALAKVEGNYSQLSQMHITLTDKLQSVNAAEGLNIPTLLREMDELKREVETIQERCFKTITYKDWTSAYKALEECYETLVGVFTELTPDPEKAVSRENYDNLMRLSDTLKFNIGELEKSIEKSRHKIEHYDELKVTGSVVCPSCQFAWIRDFNQADYDRTIETRDKCVQMLTEAQQQLKTTTEQLQYIVNYQRVVDPYNQISRHNQAMQDICVYINQNDLVKKAPRQILQLIEMERANLLELQKVNGLNAQIEEKIQSLQLARRSQDANAALIKEQLAANEEQLGELVHEKSNIAAKLQIAKQYRQRLQTFDAIGGQIDAAKERLERTMGNFMDAVRNELIDKMLVDTHSSIAVFRNNLNEIESQETLLNDMQAQMSILELDERAYKELTKALSPVDGLIADGMLGFIRKYVFSMNSLIAKVWSYRLEVKDCSLDEHSAELNYKFPLFVAGNEEPTPDVAKSSSGQQDMVDLAFKIVAMQSAGLEGYPLVLDEFGKAFDQEHRDASVRVITDIIDQLGFKQIFMISHYESCWGAFNKAEICVMDRRNITLPKGTVYNEHVEFVV